MTFDERIKEIQTKCKEEVGSAPWMPAHWVRGSIGKIYPMITPTSPNEVLDPPGEEIVEYYEGAAARWIVATKEAKAIWEAQMPHLTTVIRPAVCPLTLQPLFYEEAENGTPQET